MLNSHLFLVISHFTVICAREVTDIYLPAWWECEKMVTPFNTVPSDVTLEV